jgi:DNA-binding NtrC family response regulator
VIILTGHGSIDSAVECTKLGAYGYLSKPYELEKLLEVLKGAYEARQWEPSKVMGRLREQMQETPTVLSILKRLRKLDDDRK